MNPNTSRDTICAQGGGAHDPATGGVVPALQPSSTFERTPDNKLVDPDNYYQRYSSPNVRIAENAIAKLEGAAAALLFSSGMAAALAVFRRLPPGSHVVTTGRGYFSIPAWLHQQNERGALSVDTFDPARPETIAAAIKPGETKIVWIETPVNPVYDVVDIEAAARVAHSAGALLAVDSTAASPILTRPIEWGADIVHHSATKYLNGHSDIIAGVLAIRDASLPIWADIDHERRYGGALLGAFEAWLLLRGMRTLHLRVAQACRNALFLAERLEAHPAVERITYPGLASHPQHAIARKQMQGGFGGMMSVIVKGDEPAALKVISKLKLIKVATSLGGVETLIEHRRTVEGPDTGVPGGLLRLSVGCEYAEDLWADLESALS